MIIRVLGEGQLAVGDIDRLNALDDQLQEAVDAGDEAGFADALGNLIAEVRAQGTAVPDEDLVVSDLVLPNVDASLDDVRAMLGDEGLIPG